MEVEEQQRVANVEDQHWWFRSTRRLISEMLAPWWKPGIRVLDAGCGPGGNGARFQRYGNVVGLDFDYAAVEFVRDRRAPMGPVQGSVTALPFPDASFDVVIDVTVLYHVPDDGAAGREIARVLKPGGAVFAVEPALEIFRRAHDAMGHTERRYTLERLQRLFTDNAMSIERSTYAKSFLSAPALALGAMQRIRNAPPEEARSDLEPRAIDKFTDPVFDRLASAEDRRILAGGTMPFGTSAIVVAVKD